MRRATIEEAASRSSTMRAAPVLLAMLALAGCAAPNLAPPTSAPSPIHPWGITHCAFVIAAVPVDEAKLAARLPKGFTLAPGRLSALPAGPRAAIELDAYRCASGVAFDGNLTDLAYGSHYAAVTPPDALKEKGYDAVFVKWDFLAPDAPRRAVFLQAGLPAHAGDATVDISQTGSVQATLTFADGGGFSVTGMIQPPQPAGAPLPFMEYTPLADGGLARWHARLHDASIGSGAGVVQLAPGSWVRDVVGSDSAPATIIAGTWNLDEADVTFRV